MRETPNKINFKQKIVFVGNNDVGKTLLKEQLQKSLKAAMAIDETDLQSANAVKFQFVKKFKDKIDIDIKCHEKQQGEFYQEKNGGNANELDSAIVLVLFNVTTKNSFKNLKNKYVVNQELSPAEKISSRHVLIGTHYDQIDKIRHSQEKVTDFVAENTNLFGQFFPLSLEDSSEEKPVRSYNADQVDGIVDHLLKLIEHNINVVISEEIKVQLLKIQLKFKETVNGFYTEAAMESKISETAQVDASMLSSAVAFFAKTAPNPERVKVAQEVLQLFEQAIVGDKVLGANDVQKLVQNLQDKEGEVLNAHWGLSGSESRLAGAIETVLASLRELAPAANVEQESSASGCVLS